MTAGTMRNGGTAQGKEEAALPAESPHIGGQAAGLIVGALGLRDAEEEVRRPMVVHFGSSSGGGPGSRGSVAVSTGLLLGYQGSSIGP